MNCLSTSYKARSTGSTESKLPSLSIGLNS